MTSAAAAAAEERIQEEIDLIVQESMDAIKKKRMWARMSLLRTTTNIVSVPSMFGMLRREEEEAETLLKEEASDKVEQILRKNIPSRKFAFLKCKVQRALAGTNFDPESSPYLIYNEDRSLMLEVGPEEIADNLVRDMNNSPVEGKMFANFFAQFDFGRLDYLGAIAPEDWPEW